jgi:hypothetical protein
MIIFRSFTHEFCLVHMMEAIVPAETYFMDITTLVLPVQPAFGGQSGQ